MAYFANGTEGKILDDQCAECQVADDAPCPILFVQMTYNYKQIVNGERSLLSEAMDCLIDEKGQCKMKPIIDKDLVDKNQNKFDF